MFSKLYSSKSMVAVSEYTANELEDVPSDPREMLSDAMLDSRK